MPSAISSHTRCVPAVLLIVACAPSIAFSISSPTNPAERAAALPWTDASTGPKRSADARGPTRADPAFLARRALATASWVSDGLPVAPTNSIESDPVIAPDGGGGAFVAWQDYRTGGISLF